MIEVATEEPTKAVCARINADVFRRIKVAAIMHDTSVAEIVEQALVTWLKDNEKPTK